MQIRLGWHDSGTHDASIKEWPKCGGAIGSIRFDPEINHGANAGLSIAVNMLEPVKKKYPEVASAPTNSPFCVFFVRCHVLT